MGETAKAIDILKSDYEKRKERNTLFSKRSYAKFLGLSSGRLVDIMNEKVPLSERTALQIYKKLNLSPTEQEKFLSLVRKEQLQRVDRRRKYPNGPIQYLENQQETLRAALNSLGQGFELPVDFSSVAIPFNTEKLNEAKALIRQFQYNLAALAAGSSEHTYCLNVQLFPFLKQTE